MIPGCNVGLDFAAFVFVKSILILKQVALIGFDGTLCVTRARRYEEAAEGFWAQRSLATLFARRNT